MWNRATVFVVMGWLVACARGADGAGALKMEDLAAIAKENAARIKAIDVSFTLTTEAKEGIGDADRPFPMIRCRMIHELGTGRYYSESTRRHPVTGELSDVIDAYDGAVVTRYSKVRKQGWVRKGATPAAGDVRERDWPLMAAMVYSPAGDGVGLSDGSMVSYLSKGTLAPEREKVLGRTCYVVEHVRDGVRKSAVWVDAERGALPLRWAVYGRPKGEKEWRVMMERELVDVAAVKDGAGVRVWLPVKAVMDTPGGRTTLVVDPEKTKLNPAVTAEGMRVRFPEGTAVDEVDERGKD